MSPGSSSRKPADPRLERLRADLDGNARVVVVDQGEATRAAAREAGRQGICRVTLLGPGAGLDPGRDPRRLEMLDRLLRLPGGRRLGLREAEALVSDPSWYAALLVATDRADGAVAASVDSTVAAARGVLGPAPAGPGVALAWWIDETRFFGVADAALPSAEELAGAAAALAEGVGPWLSEPVRLAFLSFSTLGSASHPRVDRVRRAREILAEGEPEWHFDGELQADSALSTEIAERKAARSSVAGRANLLLFPDLDSGKIAVELMQVLARSPVIGPILLGPGRPVYPCPGGTVDEILDLLTVVAFEAKRGSS